MIPEREAKRFASFFISFNVSSYVELTLILQSQRVQPVFSLVEMIRTMNYFIAPLILLSFVFGCRAQSESAWKYLTKEDFKIEKKLVTASDKTITLRTFNDQPVDLKFDLVATPEQFKQSDLKQISQMVSEANNATLEKASDKKSYRPLKILCYNTGECDGWLVTVFYQGTAGTSGRFSVTKFSADAAQQSTHCF